MRNLQAIYTNTMNQSCLIKGHSAGLGSLINNAILWAYQYPKISVDWSVPDVLYGPKTWESLFEPLPPPEEPFDTVCVYPEQWLTWRWAGDLYRGSDKAHLDWRERCHELWRLHFRVRREIVEYVDRFVAEHFNTHTVAVQVRWHGHSAEQLAPHRSQTLEEYGTAIMGEIGYCRAGSKVYVAASDSQTLDWFRSKLSGLFCCHPTARRGPTRDSDFHRDAKQTEQDAIDALTEMLLMSRADTLIHPISNMSTAALYFNPQLKSVYIP